MIPRGIEVLTVIDFEDENGHFLQNWEGQIEFREGEVVNLRGNLGISNCRPGHYEIHPDNPASQLTLNTGKPDLLYKFYKGKRVEE